MPKNTFNTKFLAITQRPLDLCADMLVEVVRKRVRKPNNKPNTFAIMMTDRSANSKHIRNLIKELNKTPKLVGQQKTFWGKRTPSSLKYGDFLVFGDAPKSFKYDYRIVSDVDSVQEATGKFYDLVEDQRAILAAINRYRTKKYGQAPKNAPCCRQGNVNVKVTVNVNSNTKKKKSKGWIRAQVFTNYVKVGFDQFDILEDICGNEYVIIDRQTFAIGEDMYGNRLLVQ